ncbi:MAG: response regulator [Bdellovibrionales bacterium]|nr:response regulator [Bdellovibrionales bacterium]
MSLDWKQITILVVEDDHFLRSSLCEVLEMEGATVLQAENGQQALEIVRTHPIKFVLSDIKMPVMDGINLLKAIRAEDPNVPIVLLATGESSYNTQEVLSLGGSGLLRKPFEIATLIECVEHLINKS